MKKDRKLIGYACVNLLQSVLDCNCNATDCFLVPSLSPVMNHHMDWRVKLFSIKLLWSGYLSTTMEEKGMQIITMAPCRITVSS